MKMPLAVKEKKKKIVFLAISWSKNIGSLSQSSTVKQ